MDSDRPIMVVSDDVASAELVANLLQDDFPNIVCTHQSEDPANDFHEHEPAVVLLAFSELKGAEQYCLGLYRLSKQAHIIEHQTLVLCKLQELKSAYTLCCQQYFDDYVLFWPTPQDNCRLKMAVHHAFQRLQRQDRSLDTCLPGLAELGEHSEQIQCSSRNLEAVLEKSDASMANFRSSAARFSDSDLDRMISEAEQQLASLKAIGGRIHSHAEQQSEIVRELQQVNKLQVLIVEDDLLQQELVDNALRELPVELRGADTIARARVVLGRQAPDLVILDVGLPDGSGLDFAREMKQQERYQHLPLIMLTGDGRPETVMNSRDAGANSFVVKPFAQNILRQRVEELLALA